MHLNENAHFVKYTRGSLVHREQARSYKLCAAKSFMITGINVAIAE